MKTKSVNLCWLVIFGVVGSAGVAYLEFPHTTQNFTFNWLFESIIVLIS